MDQSEKIKYWMELSEYDLSTAQAMLETRRYLYVGYMCHQAVEKALKGFYVKSIADIPPYTHNLKHLSEKSNLVLTDDFKKILDTLTPLNIEARYPTYKEKLLEYLTENRCKEILSQTQTFIQWIRQQL